MRKIEFKENINTTITHKNYDRPKTNGECGILYIVVLNVTNDERCSCEIKSRFAMSKDLFKKQESLLTRKLDLNLRQKLLKCSIWSMAI